MPFTEGELDLLSSTPEVRIETGSGGRGTIIWIVVDDGEVFVRSVRGERGKWYQRALKDPDVVIDAGGSKIRARAVRAADQKSVERTSAALQRKYRKGRSLDSMMHPDVLATTMRLDPL